MATTYLVNGTDADFLAKYALAIAGDTIQYPAGTFSSAGLTIEKAIKVLGAGEGETTLNTSGSIYIGAAARFSGFTVNSSPGVTTIVRYGGISARGAVVEHVTLHTTGGAHPFVWAGGGLISWVTYDNSGEGIWTTAMDGTDGHTLQNTIWGAATTIGQVDPDKLTVENCRVVGNGGYASDFGYGSKIEFRFNTITGRAKLDVHGCETTYRSTRQCEAYFNRWTIASETYTAMMDLRGGKLMIFGNRSDAVAYNWMNIHTYGIEGNIYGGSDHPYAPLLNHTYWTPDTYPIPDQTGNGPDPRVGGADPSYVFDNYNGLTGQWNPNWGPLGGTTLSTNSAGYAIGATSITITTPFDGQNAPRIGTAFKIAGDSTYYVFTSEDLTNARPTTVSFNPPLVVAIPPAPTNLSIGPLVQYQYQTSNPSASFTSTDIIKPDRDIFTYSGSFNGSSGVGKGTKAQMLAITPTKKDVGFWVVDEGSWNKSFTGIKSAIDIAAGYFCEIVSVGTTDFIAIGAPSNTVGAVFRAIGEGAGSGTVKPAQGRFYTDNGSHTWTLKYEPSEYPSPLASSGGGGGTAPAVVVNPDSQTLDVGATLILTVVASGSDPISYQWYKDGTAITGATSSVFTLGDIQLGGAGSYYAIVTNPYGSATSASAVIVVTSPTPPPPTPTPTPGKGKKKGCGSTHNVCGEFPAVVDRQKGQCFPYRLKRDCEAPSITVHPPYYYY